MYIRKSAHELPNIALIDDSSTLLIDPIIEIHIIPCACIYMHTSMYASCIDCCASTCAYIRKS